VNDVEKEIVVFVVQGKEGLGYLIDRIIFTRYNPEGVGILLSANKTLLLLVHHLHQQLPKGPG
jgi:hypothetical protein